MHRNFWSGQAGQYDKSENYNIRKNTDKYKDDMNLILPLLLLLISDGGDRLLIMVLIYILS